MAAQPEPEKMAVTTSPDPPGCSGPETLSDNSASQGKKEAVLEDPTPPAAGMKSRLQRLAEQRKCWDGSSKIFFFSLFGHLDTQKSCVIVEK